MADTFDMLRSYTPQELTQIQQILAQRYQNAALQNQNMNTVASMTKNLSPAANLGIALGTLGGRLMAQNWNNRNDLKFLQEYLNFQKQLAEFQNKNGVITDNNSNTANSTAVLTATD